MKKGKDLMRDKPYRRAFAEVMKKNGFAYVSANLWVDVNQIEITIDEPVIGLLDAMYTCGFDDGAGARK